MGKKTTQDLSDKEIRDSAVTLYSYTSYNIPYRGAALYHPAYGPLVNVNYTKTNIVLIPSTKSVPDFADRYTLEQRLSDVATQTSLLSFIATGAGVAQANIVCYVDNGKLIRTTAQTVKSPRFALAQGVGNIGKSVGSAVSYVNVGITLVQVGTQGVNANTGTDMVICAIGFVPGIGWVISGVYTIANITVTAITGKSIPTIVEETLFEKWCRFNRELENRIWSWIRPPFY